MLAHFRLLLLPIAWLYGLVVALRNQMFNWKLIKSERFAVPVISVGNITVGGTGKTPHIEYLIRLLQPHFTLAMVSRGYLRKTKGVVVANTNDSTINIGDEPLQMKQKFPQIEVVAAEKRVDGIKVALKLPSQPKVVLLDDAFQHRYVTPGFSILLVDYNRPIWSDHLLPAGNLREWRCGSNRADVVIITKCPTSLTSREAQLIEKKLNLASKQQLFFSTFEYGSVYPISNSINTPIEISPAMDVLAFTALANAKPVHHFLAEKCARLHHIDLPDHHQFTNKDIEQLLLTFNSISNSHKAIVVTEKDAVKLREMKQLPIEIVSNMLVLPIEPIFLFSHKELFDKTILKHVGKS